MIPGKTWQGLQQGPVKVRAMPRKIKAFSHPTYSNTSAAIFNWSFVRNVKKYIDFLLTKSNMCVHERVLSNWPAQVTQPQISQPTLIPQPRAQSVARIPSQPCASRQPLRSRPVQDPAQETPDHLLRCCVLATSLPPFCTPSYTLCYYPILSYK